MASRPAWKWASLVAAALVGGVFLYEALELMLWQSRVDAGKVNDPYFSGIILVILIGGCEPGLILGLMSATAYYRRSLWSTIRNATIASWLFLPLNVYLTFRLLPY